MSYTIEQKREALKRLELWWRVPGPNSQDCEWSRFIMTANSSYLDTKHAEYFIGPTPPRVLTELEGELLGALKAIEQAAFNDRDCHRSSPTWQAITKASEVLQKAEGTA